MLAFDPRPFLLTEWQVLRKSDTVKGLVAMESLAIAAFVEQVLSGEQEISIKALRGWAVLQGALILVFLLRKAQAGIEVQLAGAVPAEIVKGIEKKAEARAVAAIDASHPEAAAALKTALEQQPPSPAVVMVAVTPAVLTAVTPAPTPLDFKG